MSEATANLRCPDCGAPTETINGRRIVGTRCTSCSWSVITTYTPPIEQDGTQYVVKVRSGDPHNKRQVKLIAQLIGGNFLQARQLMQQVDPTVFIGRASEVLAVRQTLANADFVVVIEPDFKW